MPQRAEQKRIEHIEKEYIKKITLYKYTLNEAATL